MILVRTMGQFPFLYVLTVYFMSLMAPPTTAVLPLYTYLCKNNCYGGRFPPRTRRQAKRVIATKINKVQVRT